ncbi:hypothetical protein [Lysinibacillus mangiferihumi]|nr:hypothetical protein [Lysinibacillus mangiferihumi]
MRDIEGIKWNTRVMVEYQRNGVKYPRSEVKYPRNEVKYPRK